ncbi:hypothetical protein CcCBS67573_g00178 [Chytriomyces confervae]|uniref:Uncharacterized protein n=1 Tax=Chytriomyces confervae TaxID=246404 RepID=A0A507FT76_9FUNG|nr:hypothetical protein CcCBS67573_g00178 [Chytriomyces confervae]
MDNGMAYDPNSTRQQGNEAYSFVSEPRAVQAAGVARKKYRDPSEADQRAQPVNIMYDRRIHRGNTYASPVIPLHAQPDPVEVQKQNEIKRRLKAKRRAEAQRRVRTPDAVDGRKHIDIQTDLYLEELSDKIPEAFAATQTDAFLDRAPSPLYIPQKSGSDVATQVYEGELFDFDFEVEPILEVLVGKTLEQALMEVAEEEELAVLKKHQLAYEEKRNAELAEVQRMEDAERRRTEEKERRLTEQIRLMKEKQDAAEKVAARAFAQAYLSNLVPSVFDSLSSNGYFYDTIEKEVETLFLPWLSGEVDKNMVKLSTARTFTDDPSNLYILAVWWLRKTLTHPFTDFATLDTLDLSHNQLTGTVPESFFAAAFGSAKIESQSAVGSATEIWNVQRRIEDLSGRLPASMSRYQTIEGLDLSKQLLQRYSSLRVG